MSGQLPMPQRTAHPLGLRGNRHPRTNMLNRQKAHDTVTRLTIDLLSYNEELGHEPLKPGEAATFDTAGFVEHAPPKGKFTISWYVKRRTYDVEVDSFHQVHVKRREG